MLRRMKRPNHLLDNLDLLPTLVLVGLGAGILSGFEGPAAYGLAGALIGGGLGLAGHWFNRLYLRLGDAAKARKVRKLIAAELVNVTSGLLDAERVLEAKIRASQAGGSVGNDLTGVAPRPMSRTAELSAELLLLTEQEIDVLATLENNLALSRSAVAQEATSTAPMLSATRLHSFLRNDADVVRQAFLLFAPDRKLLLDPAKPPELAVDILDRMSKRSI